MKIEAIAAAAAILLASSILNSSDAEAQSAPGSYNFSRVAPFPGSTGLGRFQAGRVTLGRNAVRTPYGVRHNSCQQTAYGVRCGGVQTPYGVRSNRCQPTLYGLRCF